MTRKTAFFEEWSWFEFNNLGLSLGTNLKFYYSLSKGLKLKVRKFWDLIPTFVEVTGEKLVGGALLTTHPPILNRVKKFYENKKLIYIYIYIYIHNSQQLFQTSSLKFHRKLKN